MRQKLNIDAWRMQTMAYDRRDYILNWGIDFQGFGLTATPAPCQSILLCMQYIKTVETYRDATK